MTLLEKVQYYSWALSVTGRNARKYLKVVVEWAAAGGWANEIAIEPLLGILFVLTCEASGQAEDTATGSDSHLRNVFNKFVYCQYYFPILIPCNNIMIYSNVPFMHAKMYPRRRIFHFLPREIRSNKV